MKLNPDDYVTPRGLLETASYTYPEKYTVWMHASKQSKPYAWKWLEEYTEWLNVNPGELKSIDEEHRTYIIATRTRARKRERVREWEDIYSNVRSDVYVSKKQRSETGYNLIIVDPDGARAEFIELPLPRE